MSSKVKSEKTKVKFAQSNINHVYKGNTTETHHKPTVRQYGMQVVGKLQGTRRLPPPAWVPSIKAETGGLDSRVSLVPPGGGGWGAPSTSTSNSEQPAALSSTESDSRPTVPSLSTVNGALYSETVGLSLDSAYAKIGHGVSDPGVTNTITTNADTSVGVNGSLKTTEGLQAIQDGSLKSKVPNHMSKLQNDKPSSGGGGGLAANKPFFQRPTPVVTTPASTPTTTPTKSENAIKPVVGSGAREIVGEPSGWVAISQDQLDFDERIVFSDGEDCDDATKANHKSTTATSLQHISSSEQPSQFPVSPPVASASIKSSNIHPTGHGAVKPFVNPLTSLSGSSVPSHALSAPQKMFMENPSLMTSNTAWSVADISYGVNSSGSCFTRPPPTTQNPLYSNVPSMMNAPYSGMPSEINRSLPNAQFINSASSTGVMDSFYSTHQLQNRLAASATPIANLSDTVRSTADVDSELQQAQRQARTQEFRNAVERAQQARARQRLSESCSADSGDTNLPKSALGLLSSMSENRTIASVPAPFSTMACQPGPNYMFPPSDHSSSVNPMLSVPPHNLLPPAFPTSGSLDITTAIAAATAAAMAYTTGGSDNSSSGGIPGRNVEMSMSVPTGIPHTPQGVPVSSNTASGAWQQIPFAALGANSMSTAAVMRLLSQHPHMAQLLQNALGISAAGGGSQVHKSSSQQQQQHSQNMFVNPDFFVERFLEILKNQPQLNRSQGPPPSAPVTSEMNTLSSTTSSLQQQQDQSPTATVNTTNTINTTTQVLNKHPDDSASASSQNMGEFDGRASDKTHRAHKTSQLSSSRSDAPPAVVATTAAAASSSDSPNQGTSRVPGLMDIKVSCASSQHLAHIWDKEDNLLESGSRGYRGGGRGKSMTSYNKPQRGGNTRSRGTSSKNHLLDSATLEFKSMNLRDTSNPKYPLEEDDYGGSYRSQGGPLKSIKPWNSKSRSVDDTALDTYATSSRSNARFISGDDHHKAESRKQRNTPLKDNCWMHTGAVNVDVDVNNSPFVSTTSDENDESDECGVLSDVQEGEATEDDKEEGAGSNAGKKKVDVRSSKHSSHPSSSQNADSSKDKSRSYNTYSSRRGRRGRVGTTSSHFTSSRSYTTDDFSSYASKRYSKGSEHDYYWRQQYASGSKGLRTSQSTGGSVDQRKHRSNDDMVYKSSERANHRSAAVSGYFTGGGRMTRSYVQYESSSASTREQNATNLMDSSYYSSSNGSGRQMRSQKALYYGHRGQFSSTAAVEYYSFSDGEQEQELENRSHATRRTSNHSDVRARSHAVSGRFHKSYRRNPANVSAAAKSSDASNPSSNDHEQTTNTGDNVDDSDVPTVRVPASDSSGYMNHYTHPRSNNTNRLGTQKVLALSKRITTNRASQHQQQQSKRLDGSAVVHSSRRYREMRDRYNDDEKDDDGGGAAAGGGGAGRSAASGSGGNSTSVMYKGGGGSGTGNNSDTRGGNQSGGGGGHRDSTTVDFVDGENLPDNNNVVMVNTGTNEEQQQQPGDENNVASRSTQRRRQITGTGAGPANQTEGTGNSGVSTSPSSSKKTEKSSRFSRTTGSSNHQHTYTTAHRSYPRISRTTSTNTAYNNHANHHRRNYDSYDYYYYGYNYDYYYNDHRYSTIPPLMSVKPNVSLSENTYDLDTWTAINGKRSSDDRRSDTNGGTTTRDVGLEKKPTQSSIEEENEQLSKQFHQPVDADYDNDDVEDTSFVSGDGFTKVVSKSSKYFARRKLQQQQRKEEGEGLVKVTSSNSEGRPKKSGTSLYNTKTHSSAVTRTVPLASSRAQNQVDTMMTTTTDSKSLPNGLSSVKKKYLPSKITFMGPPMSCLEVSENVGNSITTTAYNQPITTCNSACTISTTTTSSVLQKISISTTATTTTTRTWSKVVGTKFAKSPQSTSALSANPIDESTHKALSSSSNSVWQTDQVRQIVGVLSSNNTEQQNTHGDSMLPKTNNNSSTSDTTTKTIATTINNMQSLWSTNDDSLVNKNNNRSSKNDLNTSIPTATTTTTVISSAVSPSSSTAAAASYSSSSQISNNICKVKPQQQLLQTAAPVSSSLVSNSMMSVNPLSPNNIVLVENVTNISAATGTDMVMMMASEPLERSDYDCCSDVGGGGQHSTNTTLLRSHATPEGVLPSSSSLSNVSFQPWASPSQSAFSSVNNPSLSSSTTIPLMNRHDATMFSTTPNLWPPMLDQQNIVDMMNISCCLTGGSTSSSYVGGGHPSQLVSNVLSSHNTNSGITMSSLDGINKQPSSISNSPRQQHQQAHQIQSYQNSVLPLTSDRLNIYSNGHYVNNNNNTNNNNSPEMQKLSQQMTYVSGAGAAATPLYVHPQSTTIQPPVMPLTPQSAHSRSFHQSLQPQISQSRKCRQMQPQPAPHMDPNTFAAANGYSGYPTDLKGEFNYPPSIAAGCLPPQPPPPPPPTAGLYSAIHAHSQPLQNYPQNSGRPSVVGYPTTVNSWSLLGSPSAAAAASNIQGTGQPYAPTAGNNAGGLLPHPVVHQGGGYNNTQCHFPTPITSNSVSNYANQSNYVGVIGGGRPNTATADRQRSLQQHHSLFTHPPLPQSPSAAAAGQGQQQSFQLPSNFYPSISPSHHQRVSLQQFNGTSSRSGPPMNPQGGLYGPPPQAAAFGGASHHHQPTPPPPPMGHHPHHQLNPLGFFNNPTFQYPTRPDGLH
ncbi:unnamed protein product [Trichobilharzia szidati]|nr:unnamed protein product [Trichobilharzia szidati]